MTFDDKTWIHFLKTLFHLWDKKMKIAKRLSYIRFQSFVSQKWIKVSNFLRKILIIPNQNRESQST